MSKIRMVKEIGKGGPKTKIYDYSGDPYSANATNPELAEKLRQGMMQMGEGNTLNGHVSPPTYEVAGNEVFLPDKTDIRKPA